ncbi:MAG: NAD-dependent epimerase/dehydratase family protein, partial [Chryseobacterium gambrini]|nr:NAD-dependent epimerase/dehydratase family protein [Chryseobacterium gambrini]
MKETVLITGANGLVAKELSKKLEKEYTVRFLTRKKQNSNEFEWDIRKGIIDETAFDNVSHIIHLAGANISEKRWTDERKKELISSRVDSAGLLLKT